MHLDGRLIAFQQFQLLIELLFPVFLNRLERILIKVLGFPQPVQFALFLIFLHLPPMQHHKAMLILGAELLQNLHLLIGDINVREDLVEHYLN